jgi:beta-galactosidase
MRRRPDVNSHFGIIDMASFEKDRFYWYKAYFPTFNPPPPPLPPPPSATATNLYIFPYWSGWTPGSTVNVWAFANAASVELFLNGASLGKQTMPQYSHVEWNVPYTPGSLQAVARDASGNTLAVAYQNTTGAPAALQVSIRDGVGSTLYAGCQDAALIQVYVVDSDGNVVPTANNTVTFSVSGPATYAGASNGDPACLVNNKSPSRPAFHGKLLGVVLGPNAGASGTVVVTATSPGLAGGSVSIPVYPGPPPSSDASASKWCHTEPFPQA